MSEEISTDSGDLDEDEILALDDPTYAHTGASRPHPRPVQPLVQSLHVENLKSLAGPHDIPLAPVTLIYGPNAAGKSTILQALRIFATAMKAGRHDALHLCQECFGEQGWELPTLITDHNQEHTLKIGVALAASKAVPPTYTELGFHLSPSVSVFLQTSRASSTQGDFARKVFRVDYEGESWGEVEPKYNVGPDEEHLRPVRADNELVEGCQIPGTPAAALSDRLFDVATYLVFLGPHRGDPRGKYEPSRALFRRAQDGTDLSSMERVNKYLQLLGVHYKFEGEPITQANRWVKDWKLKDTRRDVEVRPDQVGYGVSQVLPVIEACTRGTGQLICIEQPELHIHPRLQAKLGSLFAVSVRRGNQIIAETHSESIMLRIRRLIRQRRLRPEQVALLYVDNDAEHGASVRHLRLGRQGELLDPWPTGFFDDSIDDVLGGWQ